MYFTILYTCLRRKTTAWFQGKLTCCELLIQQGADINSLDGLGRTPLHYACVNSNRMVACLLLNHGADPHALDSEEKVFTNLPKLVFSVLPYFILESIHENLQ